MQLSKNIFETDEIFKIWDKIKDFDIVFWIILLPKKSNGMGRSGPWILGWRVGNCGYGRAHYPSLVHDQNIHICTIRKILRLIVHITLHKSKLFAKCDKSN